MLVYLLVPIICLLMIVLTEFKQDFFFKKCIKISLKGREIIFSWDQIIYICLVGILLFLAAFRCNIGFDYNNYLYIFNLIQTGDMTVENSTVEIGYYLLNMIISNFNFLIFITACLAIIPKVYIFFNKSEEKYFTLFLYYNLIFLMYDMGVIRQGIAMAFGILSIKYIYSKKTIKFLLCILFGMLFHVSALVYLPLYYFRKIELNRKYFYFIIICTFLLSFINYNEVFRWMATIISNERLSEKFIIYSQLNDKVSILSFLKRIFYVVIIYEFMKRHKVNDKLNLIFFNGLLLSLIITGIFSSLPIIGIRTSLNLFMLQIFLFPRIVKRIDRKYLKFIIFILFVTLSFESLIEVIEVSQITNQSYIPYKSIFYIR